MRPRPVLILILILLPLYPMRIPPFYTRTGHLSLEHVWHDHDDCAIAQGISADQRVAGDNNYPRCAFCRILDGTRKAVRPRWSQLRAPALFPAWR